MRAPIVPAALTGGTFVLLLVAAGAPTAAAQALPAAGGTYQLVHQGTGRCLDVPSYAKASGVALQGYACKQAGYRGNQQLALEAVTGGYRLRVHDSQLCLDLPSSATADGTLVQQSLCHAGQNQTWGLTAEPYGRARITARLDATKCMYVDTAGAVRISRCTGLSAAARSFGFAATRTHHSIRLAASGQCLDMPSYATATGATPQLYGCKTDPADVGNQEWTFEPAAAGLFRLRQRHAGKCLDLRGGSLADGAIVEQVPCSSAASQQWRLLVRPDEQWVLHNAASGKCADFFDGALQQWTCSGAYASTQQFRIEPGRGGPPTGMAAPGALPLAATGPSPLWAVDPSAAPPQIGNAIVADNAIFLEWSHGNAAASQRFYAFTWESLPNNPAGTGHDEYTSLPATPRSLWLGRMDNRAMVPGRAYTIDVVAVGAAGISAFHAGARFEVTLPGPSVRIGDGPSGQVWRPQPLAGFAVFDADGDGVVDGAPGAGGVFPRWPSSSGASPVAATGNLFAVANGQRANLVVGYFLAEGAATTFVAHHLLVDLTTLTGTSIAVLYGDTSGALGSRVWVSPAGSPGTLGVTLGDPARGSPTIVEGTVTAPALASDGTTRVIDFDFLLAVEPG